MEADDLGRIFNKIQLIEDCLRRGLDQLDDDHPDKAGWRYVKDQVDRANGYVTDVKCLLLKNGIWPYQSE